MKKLELAARSITAMRVGFGIETITLFEPTAACHAMLDNMDPAEVFCGAELVDQFDDGKSDTHVNNDLRALISTTISVGKEHTVILTFNVL